MLPYILLYSQFDLVRTFLYCFNYAAIPVCIQIISMCLHPVYCYIFVTKYDFGIQGAATASTITSLTNAVIVHLYVTFKLPDLKQAWTFPTLDSVRGLKPYLAVVFPSMLMLFLDWSAFEFHSLIASLISVDVIAAQVIIVNTCCAYFSFTIGL
jgi:Na+-driven multidrug efflux pump